MQSPFSVSLSWIIKGLRPLQSHSLPLNDTLGVFSSKATIDNVFIHKNPARLVYYMTRRYV